MRIKNRKGIYGEQRILNSDDELIGEEPFFLPAATGLDLQAAAKRVEEFHGVCYPAHIDREANGLLSILGAFPEQPAFLCAELREEANRFLAGNRRILVCSDAHRLWELKEAGDGTRITLDAEKNDPQAVRSALIDAIRRGTV